MDVNAFRASFPEFNDSAAYPTGTITFWATVAEQQVSQTAWGSVRSQGVMLYVAHEISIAAQNARAGKSGGVPGTSGGIATTKTVGSVNVSYDAATTTEKDAGWWNRTTYGQQFIRLARLFGAGCIQL